MNSNKSSEGDSKMQSNIVTRRSFLVGAGAAAIGATWIWSLGRQPITAEAAAAGAPKMVTIISFKDDGTRTNKESVARVVKTEDEWRKQQEAGRKYGAGADQRHARSRNHRQQEEGREANSSKHVSPRS